MNTQTQENEASSLREPVATVTQILNEFPLLDDEGLDEEKHHCEWTLQQDRKRLHAMLYTHPAPLQNEFAKTKSWQGLSDSDFHEAHDTEFRRGAAWAEQILEEKNR